MTIPMLSEKGKTISVEAKKKRGFSRKKDCKNALATCPSKDDSSVKDKS